MRPNNSDWFQVVAFISYSYIYFCTYEFHHSIYDISIIFIIWFICDKYLFFSMSNNNVALHVICL